MKVNIVKYDKLYYRKKNRGIVDIYLSNIDRQNDINKIFKTIYELMKAELVFIFNDLNFFEDDELTKKLLPMNEEYFKKHGEYLNISRMGFNRMISIGKINKNILDKKQLLNIWNCFEGISIFSIENDLEWLKFKENIKNNKKIIKYQGDYLAYNNDINISISLVNDGDFVKICFDSNKINTDEINEKINNIL